jgi:hypothetical protein
VALGCGVAQIVGHRLAVRQARVRISARQCGMPEEALDRAESNDTSSINKILYVCSINVKINARLM